MISFKNFIFEESEKPSKLGHVAKIGTNMEDADFWITRVHDSKNVGKPTKEYQPHHLGVKITATDRLDPKFAYYLMHYIHGTGYFSERARGVGNRVNIKKSDVSDIPLKFE